MSGLSSPDRVLEARGAFGTAALQPPLREISHTIDRMMEVGLFRSRKTREAPFAAGGGTTISLEIKEDMRTQPNREGPSKEGPHKIVVFLNPPHHFLEIEAHGETNPEARQSEDGRPGDFLNLMDKIVQNHLSHVPFGEQYAEWRAASAPAAAPKEPFAIPSP